MHSKYPNLDAEELRSVALLALVESARTWNPQCASFSTWSGRRIEWALVDYIRVQGRRSRIQEHPVVGIDDLSPADAVHISDEGPNPESEATTRILAKRITKAVEQLRAPAPDILKLFYVEGWTQQRIGKALEMSESRVSQIHAHAIARLKHRFGSRPLGARRRTSSDSELMRLVRHVGR
jgi:RNA polymerase sigma factor (sigma-70 family)